MSETRAAVPKNVTFIPAGDVAVGRHLVDGEGLMFRVAEVHTERSLVFFVLDRNPHLICAPTQTPRMRLATQVRVLVD